MIKNASQKLIIIPALLDQVKVKNSKDLFE